MSLQKKVLKNKPVCKVTFTLPIDVNKKVKETRVLGEFNDWDWEKGVPMKVKNGNYIAEMELPIGKEYQFRYVLDNEVWVNDQEADAYITTPYGVDNSVLVV